MLTLGQLHHAISELEGWLETTDRELESLSPPPIDNPRQLEIELAKHKVGFRGYVALVVINS